MIFVNAYKNDIFNLFKYYLLKILYLIVSSKYKKVPNQRSMVKIFSFKAFYLSSALVIAADECSLIIIIKSSPKIVSLSLVFCFK